jgi:hypothetical protein
MSGGLFRGRPFLLAIAGLGKYTHKVLHSSNDDFSGGIFHHFKNFQI